VKRMTDPWRTWDSATRERAYSPSSCIGGDYRPFVAAYVERSTAARAQGVAQGLARLDLACGAAPSQRLDLFVPPTSAAGEAPPLLVFIHGGYWQELSKNESVFAASDALAAGVAFAALDYTLAPAASVASIVEECRQAITWLHARAAEFGFDAARIAVAGSSAGAHLAAMCALPGTAAAPFVRAAALVSGIYALEPLVGTSINDALGLDAAAARAASPALAADLRGFPPTVVCWGENETGEFKRQGCEFAAALQDAGTPCEVFEVPARNHFDVILDLADADTRLGAATLALVRSA